MRFNYELRKSGWAVARISDDEREVVITVSYLHDSLTQLAQGILDLIAGKPEVTIIFMDEPGEHHIVFWQQHDKKVKVEVRWFKEWSSLTMGSSDRYKVVMKVSVPFHRIYKSVMSALDGIFVEYGMKGYKENWVAHDFPILEYQELQKFSMENYFSKRQT